MKAFLLGIVLITAACLSSTSRAGDSPQAADGTPLPVGTAAVSVKVW